MLKDPAKRPPTEQRLFPDQTTMQLNILFTSSSYLAPETANKSQEFWDCLQKAEEVVIIITEALTKH